MDWWVDGLVIDWLVDYWLEMNWWVNGLIGGSIVCLVDWLVMNWFGDRWMVRWIDVWMDWCLMDWLVDRLMDGLMGWLKGGWIDGFIDWWVYGLMGGSLSFISLSINQTTSTHFFIQFPSTTFIHKSKLGYPQAPFRPHNYTFTHVIICNLSIHLFTKPPMTNFYVPLYTHKSTQCVYNIKWKAMHRPIKPNHPSLTHRSSHTSIHLSSNQLPLPPTNF